jgi:hypothetical protein
MTRLRAADDFTVIRARMEELRREAVPAPVGSQTRALPPRPYHTASARRPASYPRRLPRAIRQKIFNIRLPWLDRGGQKTSLEAG